MAESPVGVLFLSGAGLPPWMWDNVRARVTDHPTYVGPRPPGADASLGDHATAALDAAESERVVIVAHSAGGMVAAEIAGQRPDRVAGLLGVSCVVPSPGASFVGSMPFPNRVILGLVMRMLGTRPPEKALRAQAAGLPEPVVDRIVSDFVPESQRYYRDPAPDVGAPALRRYVCTTRDEELPEALQRSFARRLGVDPPDELTTGHLPMLEDPAALAGKIGSFVDSVAGASPG
jgi:pimeloyl-ACP methyl ester carboxylesterase